MVADKLNRPEDMEQLLRRLIAIAPDNAMAFNALGYSLADRSGNLIEARKLLEQANALRPGDPFIIDSLGWLAYREGNLEEALKWLQMAHDARPDTEIAAHLGEVLWQMGRREDALRVWRAAMAREAHNPILKETLQRLGARP
jgi:Flp pilus assembly protein TadD